MAIAPTASGPAFALRGNGSYSVTVRGLEGGVSTLEVTVREIFSAQDAAERIAERTGLIADRWMGTNTQLLVGASAARVVRAS